MMMILRALAGLLTLGGTVAVASASPPEWEAVKRMALANPGDVVLCGPVSFSIMELSEVGFEPRGRLTSSKARAIIFAEAGFKFGFLSKQEGLHRVYSPTPKLTANASVPHRDNCYIVDKGGERRKVEFVASHKLQIGTTEARLVLFKFETTYPPLAFEVVQRIHPIRKNGLIKGRCLATYDPFKKEWIAKWFDLCDFADIDSQFIDTGLERGHRLDNQ